MMCVCVCMYVPMFSLDLVMLQDLGYEAAYAQTERESPHPTQPVKKPALVISTKLVVLCVLFCWSLEMVLVAVGWV